MTDGPLSDPEEIDMLTRTKLAIAAATTAVAVIGGGGAYAATSGSLGSASGSSGSPAGAATPAAGKAAKHGARVRSAEGKVVSDSATGGTFGQGVLVIAQPDGNQLTFNLRTATKAVRYQGVGQKNVPESASALPAGEVVVVRYVTPATGGARARRIVDSGFAAS
jgi:hypothetical protein